MEDTRTGPERGGGVSVAGVKQKSKEATWQAGRKAGGDVVILGQGEKKWWEWAYNTETTHSQKVFHWIQQVDKVIEGDQGARSHSYVFAEPILI